MDLDCNLCLNYVYPFVDVLALMVVEVELMVLSFNYIHILYSCMPRFPLVGETPLKFSNFINMCSWYSFNFISTYQGGVLSTHRT